MNSYLPDHTPRTLFPLARNARLACLCLCVLSLSYAARAETPADWLMQMGANTSRLNYSGSLVYAEGGRMQSMRVYHSVKGGERRERMVHLSGEPREVVRRGDTVLCIDRANGKVALRGAGSALAKPGDNGFSSSFAARFAALGEQYSVSFIGSGRVAGRDVRQIELMPRDEYRHGFRLALDRDSKLLLRSLMVDNKGAVLERFEYTQIDIGGEIADADLEPQLQVGERERVARPEASAQAAARKAGAWRVGWVPPAFVPAAESGNGSSGNALVYSDGLSAFSIFVDDNSGMGQHTQQRGATIAHSTVRKDDAGPFSVTVVGEIPALAARKIAASVSRVVNAR